MDTYFKNGFDTTREFKKKQYGINSWSHTLYLCMFIHIKSIIGPFLGGFKNTNDEIKGSSSFARIIVLLSFFLREIGRLAYFGARLLQFWILRLDIGKSSLVPLLDISPLLLLRLLCLELLSSCSILSCRFLWNFCQLALEGSEVFRLKQTQFELENRMGRAWLLLWIWWMASRLIPR